MATSDIHYKIEKLNVRIIQLIYSYIFKKVKTWIFILNKFEIVNLTIKFEKMSALTVNMAQNNPISYTNKTECIKLLKVLNQR